VTSKIDLEARSRALDIVKYSMRELIEQIERGEKGIL
jgi:hypothetical protein